MNMPEDTVRYFKVDRHDLVFLKFILEAYEGMSTMTTVKREGVIVRITIPSGFTADMHELLAALACDMPLTETDFTLESDPSA